MRLPEVRMWINYHTSLFSDWKYSADSPAAKALAFNAISKALATIDVDDAKEASDRMLAGTIKRPYRNEDHVSAIVAACAAIRSQRWAESHPRVDGQQTAACPLCHDTGFVDCWRRDLENIMAVACSCPAGEGAVARWRGYAGCQDHELHARQAGVVQRYDPVRCYRVGDESEYWLDIRARRLADIAANREPEEAF